MKATVEGNVLHLESPLAPPRPSKSGKTLVVATTGGNKRTDALVEGRTLWVGVNAYVYKEDQ